MKRLTPAAVGCATLCILALAGCGSSTQLTSVWSDPTFQTNSLQKLMVIGVAHNSSVRRIFEDTFASALQGEGVRAMTGYSVLGDGRLDSAMVWDAIQKTGCDGIFVTRLVDKQTVQTYYPPTTTAVAVPAPYYGGWYGYYATGYAYTTMPGYTVENQVINLETTLYRVADGKLVWSALSQSWLEQAPDPGREIRPFVDQLVMGLTSSKIVGKTKKK